MMDGYILEYISKASIFSSFNILIYSNNSSSFVLVSNFLNILTHFSKRAIFSFVTVLLLGSILSYNSLISLFIFDIRKSISFLSYNGINNFE